MYIYFLPGNTLLNNFKENNSLQKYTNRSIFRFQVAVIEC